MSSTGQEITRLTALLDESNRSIGSLESKLRAAKVPTKSNNIIDRRTTDRQGPDRRTLKGPIRTLKGPLRTLKEPLRVLKVP